MSKEELEKIAESDEWRNRMFPCKPPCDTWGVCDNCCEAMVFDVGFSRGAQWQASHTPAVSVEGERAAEEYLLNNGGYRPSDGDCFTVRKNIFLAGFQARAPLVELMREAKEVMARAYRLSVDHHDFKLYAMEPFEKVIDRIDAALKGET